jgi:flagellar biosynthesis protein FlhF
MQTKTYRAPNMLTALQEIQRDLGPNAIVLSMREVAGGPSWQGWNKAGVEVVASVEMPARKTELKETGERNLEENVPGRKEIEAILSALAQKRNFQTLSPEELRSPASATQTKSLQSSTREPARWSPPVINSKKPSPESGKHENPAVGVLGEVVDDILEESRHGQKSGEIDGGIPPMLKLIQHRLIRQGVDKEMVDRLVETNLRTLSLTVLSDEDRLTRVVKKQLEASLHPQKNSMAVLQSRIICLVGATGSGKTSTCAKLAAYYTRTLNKKVIWISADTIRAGAISETRMYAEALEVPFFFAYSPQELGELISENTAADLIIIDTPGVNTLNEDSVTEAGTYLSEITPNSIYVTAPASMKGSDLIQMVSTFSLFNIKGLIATKMDESYTFGDIYNVMLKTHLPILFFTNGTQVIGKLHQGEPLKLISAIFGEGI